VGAARLAGILARPAALPDGEGSGSTWSSPRGQEWPRCERGRLRRALSVAPGGVSLYGLAVGETAARAAQGVARGVVVGH
jgi:hypothetical protein